MTCQKCAAYERRIERLKNEISLMQAGADILIHDHVQPLSETVGQPLSIGEAFEVLRDSNHELTNLCAGETFEKNKAIERADKIRASTIALGQHVRAIIEEIKNGTPHSIPAMQAALDAERTMRAAERTMREMEI